MKQQDAIALLKADHKAVKELFKQVEETSERAKAQLQRLGDQICAELTVHTQIEEQIFYPAVQERTKRGHKEEKDMVLESYEDHAAAKKVKATGVRRFDGVRERSRAANLDSRSNVASNGAAHVL